MPFPLLASFNCMTAASDERLKWTLSAMRHKRANIVGLQGTRRKLLDADRGFDELQIAGYIVISFGTLTLTDCDKHAGVAIALGAKIFDRNDIINIWAPCDSCKGRLEFTRIKRRSFDISLHAAYWPPLGNGCPR